MIITTTEIVPNKKIDKILGVVRGNTIRARWFGRDIAASFKTIVGGEVKSYTDLMTTAREEAYQRMVKEGRKLKADAIVNVRFMTSEVMQGSAEMLAYGTAVKLK